MENQKMENLRTLGKRAYDNEHYDDALSYFKEIQLENPNDWESSFYVIMSKVKQANLNEFDVITGRFFFVPTFFCLGVATIFSLFIDFISKFLENKFDK